MEGEAKYEYLRLKDARVAVGQTINLYGVVTDYQLPKPSKGTDWFVEMTVADMSESLPVRVFASKDNVPRVRALYDIVRLHRVEIQVHKGSPQAVASSKMGSFLLFDGGGGGGGGDEPYQASSNTFTLEDHERDILQLMRGWKETYLTNPGNVPSEYLVKIRDIRDRSAYFDLCCKVLHISNGSIDFPTFIHVWDGTDSPEATSLPFVESAALPLSVLREFPRKGTVLLLVVDVPFNDIGGWLPRVGSWVKFRNITSRACGGRLEALYTRESKIGILSAEYPAVVEAEKWYARRLASPDAGMPENCPNPLVSLTVTDYDHAPYSTLREVLASPQVTYKFRCVVRVKATNPSKALDFCSCVDGEYVYLLQLTLEDPTAQIQAYLYAEDGERFFNGYPAARRDPEDACLGALQRSFNRLLGDGVNPPYIPCCIKSYYLDKQQPWTSRRFRIFGTRFPG